MSSVGSSSLTSSSVSSFSSLYLPKSRIRCSKDRINIGNSSFQSASDALLAYLQQYDVLAGGKEVPVRRQDSPSTLLLSGSKLSESGQLDQYLAVADQISSKDGDKALCSANVTRVAEDVEDLLTSKLHAEVTDAVREVQSQHAAPGSSEHTKTQLQREVEAALLRSAKLLEKVTKEDTPSTRTSSIERTFPGNDTLALLGSSGAGKRPLGHVYSYRSSRHRNTQNQSPVNSAHLPSTPQLSGELRKSFSTDNLLPASHKLPPRHKHSFSSSSASFSHHSDPTGVLRNLRTRSLSPGLRNVPSHSPASGLSQNQDQSVRKSIPSWVQEISPSEVTDSLWESSSVDKDKKDTKPFSDLAKAGSTSVKATKDTNNSHSIKDNDLSSNSGLTAGCNLSDLGLSAIHSSSNNKLSTVFSGSGKEDYSKDKHRIRHSSPIRESLTSAFSSPAEPTLGSRTFDSEYNGEAVLHRDILPQTARLKKSIEIFVASAENLKQTALRPGSSVASSDTQCSSLDTLSLLTGKPLSRKDAAAASLMPQYIPQVSQSYSTSCLVPVSGHTSPVSVGQNQTSDGLDGDRPWETLTATFKPPVPVEVDDAPHLNGASTEQNLQRTLSGRKQPGSMETLKNMLFKLQAEENATHNENNKNHDGLNASQRDNSKPYLDIIPASQTNNSKPCLDIIPASQRDNSKPYLDIIPALQNYDFQREPGGQSLEKALVHLNRLKELVQSNNASGFSDETVKTSTTSQFLTNDVMHKSC